MLASAPAARAGGSAVVKMKPEAKLRTKSHKRGRAGDIAAHHAERLAERALDHRQPVHQALALGDAAAARAVEADRMDLVEIGHRAVLVGDVAELGDRRDVAVHRIDATRRRPAWARRGSRSAQLAVEVVAGRCGAKTRRSARLWRMPSIIEAWLPASDSTTQPGMLRGQRAERRPVGDVAGGEQQRRFLAVQVGELALEQHVVVVGAGDVAGAAGAGAAAVERLVHRLEHGRVLAHAEIVVGAPDGDLRRGAPSR